LRISRDKYIVTRYYTHGRSKYKKQWHHKKAKEKKRMMRYSTGPRWVGQHIPGTEAFLRRSMPMNLRNPDELLPDGYHVTQTWIALCKSWNGFSISKREGDHEYMKQYAGYIRKLQKNLGLSQNEFEEDFSPAELEEIDKEHDEEAQMIRYGTTLGY
jgi:hypothetical protein